MTSKEFVIWLRGFVAGSNNFNLTPAGWDALKDKLKEVDDSVPMGGIISDHNTFRINEAHSARYGSLAFNPSTSTTYVNPQSGSWHYTNGGNTDIK